MEMKIGRNRRMRERGREGRAEEEAESRQGGMYDAENFVN